MPQPGIWRSAGGSRTIEPDHEDKLAIGRKEATVNWCPGGDKRDRLAQDIFDAVTEFMGQLMHRGERIAETFDVPVYCVKAMHRIGDGVTMKDLGQSLHCDPSFVTTIADALEVRGLARREPSAADRRVKNLVLTDRGLQLKAELERHLLNAVPWRIALDENEQKQLLEFIRKMTEAISADAASQAAAPGTRGLDLTLPAEVARS